MRSFAAGCLCFCAVLLFVVIEGRAQQRPAAANDPRIGLKAGLRDAGEAAWNMKRVASLPKPEGFFDPKTPGGTPIPPERNPDAPELDPTAPGGPPTPEGVTPPFDPVASNRLGFTNSDLAFSGTHAFVGSYHGFNTYDIERPGRPRLLASVVCPGGQGDVSVHGNLLFLSVEQTRGRIDCGTQGVQTLVTDPKDTANLYIYGSGTSSVRSAEELAGCSGLKPEEDPNTALFSIDVIQVPLAAPGKARIVSRPRVFADIATGNISGLWAGGDHGPGTQKTSVTNQCHDITVFPEIGLAAGACSGNGILLDIHDPVHPMRLDDVSDKNFAYWHSATFNNDGTKVLFTDEWGGGTRPRCRASDPLTWGADAIFDIVDRKLRFGGYYKMPAAQSETENCVAHNGALIPVPGRDIMVQAWYQGGLSMFDFTDAAHPIEIGY